MPNDIENMTNHVVKENNQNNNFKNTAPNINIANKNPHEPNNNMVLGKRNDFPQKSAVSNYPNIDERSKGNPKNINDNDQNNASNVEDITDVNINTLDETVSETLVKNYFNPQMMLNKIVYLMSYLILEERNEKNMFKTRVRFDTKI